MGPAARQDLGGVPRGLTLRRALLVCGVLSSLLYVGVDLLAAMRWEGYSYASQTISELSAIGAPTRPLVVAAGLAWCVLLLGFGAGVWGAAGGKRALRLTGALLIAYGVVGFAAPFTPMHQRGAETTLTDVLHVTLTVVSVLFILLQVATGAAAREGWFRRYSLATLAVVLVFGAWAGMEGPRVAAGQPTPGVGVSERISVGAYLLWVAVLAIALLRAGRPTAAPAAAGASRSVMRSAGS